MLRHSSYQPGPHRSCPDSPTDGTASTLKPRVCPQRAILPAAARSRGREQRRELRGAARGSRGELYNCTPACVCSLMALRGRSVTSRSKEKDNNTKQKNRCKLNKWKARWGCRGGWTLVSAPGEQLQAATRQAAGSVPFPTGTTTWEQIPDPGAREMQDRDLRSPLPCPARNTLCLRSPASKRNIYIYIFALCFQAFDPPNLFVLVFVDLTVKVYDNSLLVNPIWLSLDIPV